MSQKIEEWGKTKFKPTITRTTQNPFTQPQNFRRTDDNVGGFRGRGGKFNGNNNKGGTHIFNNHRGGRGKFSRGTNHFKNDKNYRVKFNAIARDAKPDIATPWMKFKGEINYKLDEEMHEASQASMNTEEAKSVLKQREMNYRRLLMEQKKQETTHWEDFAADKDDADSKAKKKKTVEKSTMIPNTLEDKPNENKRVKSAFKEILSSRSKGNCTKVDEEKNISKRDKRGKRLNTQVEENNQANAADDLGFDCKKRKIKKEDSKLENARQPENDTQSSETSHRIKHKKKQKQKRYDGEEKSRYVEQLKSKPPLMKDELDVNKLSFQQKDFLRKVITKSVTYKKGTTFTQRLKNRMFQNDCKQKIKDKIKNHAKD